jgi:hypothetical protein
MAERIYLSDEIWVELCESVAVVSWPDGHRVLDYEAPVVELLALVRLAIADMLVGRPTKRQLKELKRIEHNKGFDEGWAAKSRQYESA